MSELGSLEEFVALVESYFERGVTDGLPIVPPTNARVGDAVAATRRQGDELLGLLAPAYRELRVRDLAINAVMAGCRPEYMKVLVAAVEVMMDPAFGLHHLATSTYGNGPLLVVNGPIRHELGINCTANVLGPGNRANATIGRAIRLVLSNVGGAVPGLTDFASFGHPGKYAYVVGEDEESGPWEPYHVEAGLAASDSAVTVLGATSPQRVGATVTARNVEVLLLRIAAVISTLAGFGATGWSEEFVLMGPDHREALRDAGWSKADVRQFLFEHSGRKAGDQGAVRALDDHRSGQRLFDSSDPRSRLPVFGNTDAAAEGRWLPAFEVETDIHLVAAGGAGGNATMVCSGQPGLDWGRHGIRRIDT